MSDFKKGDVVAKDMNINVWDDNHHRWVKKPHRLIGLIDDIKYTNRARDWSKPTVVLVIKDSENELWVFEYSIFNPIMLTHPTPEEKEEFERMTEQKEEPQYYNGKEILTLRGFCELVDKAKADYERLKGVVSWEEFIMNYLPDRKTSFTDLNGVKRTVVMNKQGEWRDMEEEKEYKVGDKVLVEAEILQDLADDSSTEEDNTLLLRIGNGIRIWQPLKAIHSLAPKEAVEIQMQPIDLKKALEDCLTDMSKPEAGKVVRLSEDEIGMAITAIAYLDASLDIEANLENRSLTKIEMKVSQILDMLKAKLMEAENAG